MLSEENMHYLHPFFSCERYILFKSIYSTTQRNKGGAAAESSEPTTGVRTTLIFGDDWGD